MVLYLGLASAEERAGSVLIILLLVSIRMTNTGYKDYGCTDI